MFFCFFPAVNECARWSQVTPNADFAGDGRIHNVDCKACISYEYGASLKILALMASAMGEDGAGGGACQPAQPVGLRDGIRKRIPEYVVRVIICMGKQSSLSVSIWLIELITELCYLPRFSFVCISSQVLSIICRTMHITPKLCIVGALCIWERCGYSIPRRPRI